MPGGGAIRIRIGDLMGQGRLPLRHGRDYRPAMTEMQRTRRQILLRPPLYPGSYGAQARHPRPLLHQHRKGWMAGRSLRPSLSRVPAMTGGTVGADPQKFGWLD